MHRGEEKTEAEKAAEETRKARRDPYRVGAHSTKRAEYDGERATDPIHLAAFSNGSFFGRGAQRLIGIITAAYAATRRRRVGVRTLKLRGGGGLKRERGRERIGERMRERKREKDKKRKRERERERARL